MTRKNWLTVLAPAAAVIVAGAIILPRSQAKTTSTTSTGHTLMAQGGPGMEGQMGGPGMGGPGMGGPGMGGPGMGGPGMGGQMMGGPGMGMMGGPGMGGPGMGRMMAAPVMVATSEYVYILRGNTLYQFSAKDLKQLNKVTLEEEPAGARSRPMMGGQGGAGGNLPQRTE